MNQFERKFQKFSITNLTMYIIVGKVFCFLLELFQPEALNMLTLDVEAIMSGQVWRLITYMFIPQSSPLWFIFEIILFYWIGTSLEREWGSFRYTMYILGSILGVTAAVVAGYLLGWTAVFAAYLIPSLFYYTMFLPFAWYNGEEELRIYFVLPIKIKYLAVVDIILIARIFYLTAGYPETWVVFLMSMLNMIVFFVAVFFRRGKQKSRLAGFHRKVSKAERQQKKNSVHRCTICGITEKDDPNMTFRYCSKCQGDYEYCEKHLEDHQHITNVVEFPKK